MIFAWNNNETWGIIFAWISCEILIIWYSHENYVKIAWSFHMKFMRVTFRLFLMRRIRMNFMRILYEIHASHFCLCRNITATQNLKWISTLGMFWSYSIVGRPHNLPPLHYLGMTKTGLLIKKPTYQILKWSKLLTLLQMCDNMPPSMP